MVERILASIAAWIIAVISSTGYAGVAALMAIESACIPLPSEIIMPFSGYLVATGRFTLWGVSVAGAVGCVLGSIVAYYAGAYGGRPFLERYGRLLLISHASLDRADRWFARWGAATVFWARLLPVVRTFIAFPAGVARMPMGRFIIYTFLGSLPWCWGLAWAGKILGDNWTSLGPYFHHVDIVIGILIVGGMTWFVVSHLRTRKPSGIVT